MAVPAAYTRAAAGRQQLEARFEECRQRLERRRGTLRSFEAVLARGKASINMPLPKLTSFLEQGGYLSVYELLAGNGLKGKKLERAVSKRLRELGPLRLKLDELFHFRHDTHYASFNLGGAGARRYGCCCVVFDLRHWAPFYTCFAGDSIRASFGSDKQTLLPEEEILAKLAVGEDLARLATLRWEETVEKEEHCVHPGEIRDIVEAEDSLLEIHLHGPVKREHILEVRLARADYRGLCDLTRRAKRNNAFLFEFDNVEPFQRMLELLERFEIPLVLAEG